MHVSARGDGSSNEEGLPDVQYEWRLGRYAVVRWCMPRIERAMTSRWISLVPS